MTGFSEKFIKARRGVIELDFNHLNAMQKMAVMTTEGPLLLLAGAGSGKTTVLINRIANLLRYGRGSDTEEIPDNVTADDLAFLEGYLKSPTPENAARARSLCAVEPVEPWRVIAITFTNKAADELKARLEKMLGPEANDVWAMTFHSACVRILRRDIDKLGFDRSFTIYDTSDSQSLMKRILKELNLDDKTFPPKTVLNYISRSKDDMVTADEFYASADKSGDIRKRQIGRAYIEYTKRTKAANALDFDDLILFTVRLFQEHEDVRKYYQKKFRYVLIDEYQDTNNLQYRFASALAGGYENICVVGDDDQSIYKFRGATIENILSFESRYKDARSIRLEQNYRSTGCILSAANDVIRNNTGRKGKELWTEKERGERPTLYIAQDEIEEAGFVASKIISDVAEGGNWRDHAILYRMNAQSNQFEYAFKRSGVPYRIVGGTRFFDRAEIKDMLAYMCVVNNPGDDLRVLRVINTPPRGIGQTTVEALRETAERENLPIFAVIERSDSYEALRKSSPKLLKFADLIGEMRGISETAPLDIFYDTLLERTGYQAMLEARDSDEDRARVENVNELKSNIVNFMKENDDGTLFDFLNETALYTDIDQLDREADCVVMMTMHSAKGLEFPTVFIVGADEGIFPSMRSIGEQDEMEEERRLCYVAMTRAEKKLYFTSARRRMLFGKTTAGKPSRFIDEISGENIEKPEPPHAAEYVFEEDEHQSGRKRDFPRHTNAGRRPGIGLEPEKQTLHRDQPVAQAAFRKGDVVVHKAFGRGMITDVRPAGSDALIEVAFDDVGTKRLMMKAASQYMKKAD